MSFYTCGKTGNIPGPICGNALNGLNERACIEVKKVLDSCMKQNQLTNVHITLDNLEPANPTHPLTFVGAVASGDATLSDLIVDRLLDKPNFARVSGTVSIPITVSYTDAHGIEGTGEGTLTSNIDVILFVPQPSVMPYSIEVFGTINGAVGTYLGDNTFAITCCATIIVKVVVNTDILVPSYGYANPPACQDYVQQVCSGALGLPIFPTAL